MSVFRPTIDPSPLASEEAVRRYLTAIRAELEPDPLFRRRLRGGVMNRFVAAREGLERPVARGSEMGRVGRACLYASVVLAMSVGGVMAASRAALPGDLLYPVKLEIEAVRMRALPSEFHDDLAVYALSERIHEMSRLAEAGDWDAVAALASEVEAGYEQLAAIGMDDVLADEGLQHRLEVLETLRDSLPAPARAAIERVLADTPGDERAVVRDKPRGAADGSDRVPNPDRVGMPATIDDAGEPFEPTASTKPDPTPRATATVRPTPTQKPTPTERPSPTPRPTPTEPPSQDDGEENDVLDGDEAED